MPVFPAFMRRRFCVASPVPTSPASLIPGLPSFVPSSSVPRPRKPHIPRPALLAGVRSLHRSSSPRKNAPRFPGPLCFTPSPALRFPPPSFVPGLLSFVPGLPSFVPPSPRPSSPRPLSPIVGGVNSNEGGLPPRLGRCGGWSRKGGSRNTPFLACLCLLSARTESRSHRGAKRPVRRPRPPQRANSCPGCVLSPPRGGPCIFSPRGPL